jgi:translocation and assembly module TamA
VKGRARRTSGDVQRAAPRWGLIACLVIMPAGASAQPDPAAAQATPVPGTTVRTPAGEAPSAPIPDDPPAKTPHPLSRVPLIGGFFRDRDAEDPDGDKVAPHYALEVKAPEPVDTQIKEFTLLGRWRQRAGYDPSQLPLFMRRADGEVRELLAAEGWFSPEVRVERIRTGVRIVVEPGPRTRVAGVELTLTGDVQAPEHAELRDRASRGWLLPDGASFRSGEWERAKRALLGELRDGGFLRARIEDSEAVVERDTAQARLRVEVESGSRLQFGEMVIGGLQRYPDDVVRGLAPFRPGDPYDARRVLEFQTRLNGAGWFTTVNVRPDTNALERNEGLDAVPMRVDVVERESKRWTLGAGYENERGVNLLVGWENRNVLGRGVQTFNGIEIDVDRQVLFSTWDTPQDLDGRRWQFGLRAEHRNIQNDLTDAASLFASRNQRRGDIETAISLQQQFERQSIVFSPDDERLFENRALVLGYSWTQRKLDSPIFPTQGYIVSAQVSGASSAFHSMRSFTRAYGFGYGIVPLAGADREEFGRVVLRGEIGAVFAGGREGIPSANLFRTGGAKSVRGYSSQSLGVDIGEAVLGGLFMLTASVEYQHLITRDLAAAIFYDRGNAADRWQDVSPVAGYGVGIRWRTPVGPLNLDVGWGEAVNDWRLHFSIGVVF